MLSAFNKAASNSFHQQKNFIKNVLAGKITLCPICQQTLSVYLTEASTSSSIRCKKQCTDIALDCS